MEEENFSEIEAEVPGVTRAGEDEDAQLPPATKQATAPEPPKIVIPHTTEEHVSERIEETQKILDGLYSVMEETADMLNESIETVLGYRPGLGGFVLKAFKGTSVPQTDGRKIDALTDKLDALEEHHRALGDRLELAQELFRRAKASPDGQNTQMLRWRAIQQLEYQHDQAKLVAAERALKVALAITKSELQVEVVREEPKAEKEASPPPTELIRKLLSRKKPTT